MKQLSSFFKLQPTSGHATPADWKSAKQQMTNRRYGIARASLVVLVVSLMTPLSRGAEKTPEVTNEPPFGIDHRIPWTNSHVIGSPEPPLPYTVEKTFTNISWRSPMFVLAEPGSQSLLVVQQGGEKERPSKIVRLHDDPETKEVETFLEVSNRLIYSFVFHPGYATN